MLARRMVVLASVATVLLALAPARGRAAGDPPLSIDDNAALAALHCPQSFSRPKAPVLLVHGTGLTADESWTHTFAKTLPAAGHDVCTIDLPTRALDDAQVSAEYVVVSIHQLAARSGRRIDVISHSQGGIVVRWALKWFPSTEALVDDYVSLSSDQHGSQDAIGACAAGRCAPSVWQQKPGSHFLDALNAGDETPGDISYTSIYSLTDEVVPEFPPPPTSIIAGGENIALQDVCPGRPADHFSMLYDAVAHALVDDALNHPGPADPSRISRATCLAVAAAGIDPTDIAYMHTVATAQAAQSTLVTGPMSSAEPPLKPYVFAGQAAATAPTSGTGAAPKGSPSASPPGTPSSGAAKALAATGSSWPAWLGLLVVAAAVGLRRLDRR